MDYPHFCTDDSPAFRSSKRGPHNASSSNNTDDCAPTPNAATMGGIKAASSCSAMNKHENSQSQNYPTSQDPEYGQGVVDDGSYPDNKRDNGDFTEQGSSRGSDNAFGGDSMDKVNKEPPQIFGSSNQEDVDAKTIHCGDGYIRDQPEQLCDPTNSDIEELATTFDQKLEKSE
jgi:hypothetical protein